MTKRRNEIDTAVDLIQDQLDILATNYGIRASLICKLPDSEQIQRHGAGVDYLLAEIFTPKRKPIPKVSPRLCVVR